ncbi:Transposon protein, putative, CACTA, En/Spm sub-class [Quillaja saponaria]|uniref:Transposon protein, putative, CACTA, En/Spm sub-class n=1 Tax=Quillaja saponaria TaxID=32244 RepID=A0AAD7LTD8_QUISA|nr:Transposon protein, putative, CACTA, En/Spm sub-class [Quillaja saponaria]
MVDKTARHMRWHIEGIRRDPNLITHPSDAEAWKKFDVSHPNFASEIRNVRLGLSTVGFNPFENSSVLVTCWPVFITLYNLPPSMCMKRTSIFLTLVIPGPNSPKKHLDVYLRPLVDELKILWDEGVFTFDAYKKQNFLMRASLLWTISDFPAYGMLSGWSTQGRLACPICMERTKSFYLKNGGKCCWFDCHQQFLPMDHRFGRNKNDFKKGIVEKSPPPLRLSGIEVKTRVFKHPQITFSRKSGRQKHRGFGKNHNWTKRSIFLELSYWETNLIRYNLDVMHIEKNVFDNVFKTLMNVKEKTKDNPKAHEDLRLLCKRPELELYKHGDKLMKPKAVYVLTDDQIKEVCEWLKQLRFPDGYVSNIARCVNVTEKKLYSMKSHDCHVFLQRLLPLATRDFLPKPIWGALAELSHFGVDICSTEIQADHMLQLEADIVEILFVLFDGGIMEEVNLNELTPRTKKRTRNELQENVDVGDDDDDINDEEDEAEEAE